MNAVIYARYSSDNQREESIEGQLRECLSYAEKNNLKIVNHLFWFGSWIVFPETAMTVPTISIS